MAVWQPGFSIQTGSVSSGNLSAFEVISRKVCKIVGDNIVTMGNKKVAHDQGKSLSHLTQLIINLFNLYVKFKPVLANLQCCTCSSLSSFSLLCRQCHNHFQNDLRLLQLCH